jgi:hypothetical protein
MAMSIDERQELALELYRSRHGLSSTTALNPTGTIGRSKSGTTSKKSSASSAALGKSPPRPSPASVAYHSDEESLKCYDENPDDSSVTEKPSEVSSSDSQVGSKVQVIGARNLQFLHSSAIGERKRKHSFGWNFVCQPLCEYQQHFETVLEAPEAHEKLFQLHGF